MKNSELIQIYKNFCKHLVRLSLDIVESSSDLHRISMTPLTWIATTQEDVGRLLKMIHQEFKDVDFKKFNLDELIELGFSSWDEELLLAPTWVIKYCQDGTIFTSINGDTKTKGIDEMDTDTRFGSTAYGFLLSELRDRKITSILEENTIMEL